MQLDLVPLPSLQRVRMSAANSSSVMSSSSISSSRKRCRRIKSLMYADGDRRLATGNLFLNE